MNIYKASFYATCPSDNDIINYQLEICTDSIIWVEHIKTALSLIKSGYHETIADELHKRFRGYQTIVAIHQGVEITTIRE